MFCAATLTPSSPRWATISSSAVNGGQITTSTPSGRPSLNSPWSPERKPIASPRVLCIFQFAASTGVRSGIAHPRRRSRGGGVEQGLHAGQPLPLDQLERGAAAGREPVHRVGEAEAREGGRRV